MAKSTQDKVHNSMANYYYELIVFLSQLKVMYYYKPRKWRNCGDYVSLNNESTIDRWTLNASGEMMISGVI